MKKNIILIGGGGHCKVIIDAIQNVGAFTIKGIVDPGLPKEATILGVPVIGSDDILEQIRKNIKYAFICMGTMGDCSTREKIYDILKKLKFTLPIIRHPKAVIAADVKIGEGTFVAAGAVINPGTKVGRNVIINTSASIDHDCEIDDFVHIAPGVTLSGGVKVGSKTHIGTGVSVIQYVTIPKNSFIPAGSLVSKEKTYRKGHIN